MLVPNALVRHLSAEFRFVGLVFAKRFSQKRCDVLL